MKYRSFFNAAVDQSCEGLIMETLNKDSTYEPSIAAFHGRGKRTGVIRFLSPCLV